MKQHAVGGGWIKFHRKRAVARAVTWSWCEYLVPLFIAAKQLGGFL
jgi:hypothetical protein